MLPAKLRNSLFDKISGVTMRKFFQPSTLMSAKGLTKEVLVQSQRDFFINGTITCHAACPPLMAGLWMGGREMVAHQPAPSSVAQESDGRCAVRSQSMPLLRRFFTQSHTRGQEE